MGNTQCCKADIIAQGADETSETTPVLDGPLKSLPTVSGGASAEERTYKVSLSKEGGGKLGLDVDYMAERRVLPVMSITGGLSEQWNKDNPSKEMKKGDSIIEVNGVSENVALMLEKCKSETMLELTLCRSLNYDFLVQDLENLIRSTNCGPALVRLCWFNASSVGGKVTTTMRLPGGEAIFGANWSPAGALGLLAPISDKYCPLLISHSDLWVMASVVAIKEMGGPEVPVRFGRKDVEQPYDGVPKVPDSGVKGADALREIFQPKGFEDKYIVALSGAHTVGPCHPETDNRTENPMVFDNSYFKDLLNKEWKDDTSSKGRPQKRCGMQVMQLSDMMLVEDPAMKVHVQTYAEDQQAWFNDFTQAWVNLHELGMSDPREIL